MELEFKAAWIKACAQAAAQNLLSTLRGRGIPMETATSISTTCGDTFGQALELSLRENGIQIS